MSQISESKNAIQNHKDLYEYSKLPHEDSVRLLVLHPGDQADPLNCDLVHHRLGDHSVYKALSYVWGDAVTKDTLTCHSSVIPVTGNLSSALRRLRGSSESQVLWVDAVCIDQQNLDERSQQVGLMGSIYRNAVEVLVHIEPSPSIEDLHMLYQIYKIDVEQTLSPILRNDRALSIWAAFWDASWFRRAWTVQEIGLARKGTVFCGQYELDWGRLMKVSHLLKQQYKRYDGLGHGGEVRALWATYNPAARSEYSARLAELPERLSFLQCISLACSTRAAKDQRDLVYAFLAHPHSLSLIPDYHQGTTDVFVDLATRWIRTYRSAEILHYVFRTDQSDEGTKSLPSWCPDWALYHDAPNSLQHYEPYFDACGPNTTSRVEVLGRRLALDVVRFDAVAHYTDALQSEDNDGDVRIRRSDLEAISSLAHEAIRRGSYSKPHWAVCRTLLAGDWDADEEESCKTLQHFPGFAQLQRTRSTEDAVVGMQRTAMEERPGGDCHEADVLLRRMVAPTWRRCLFVTKEGRFGVGPQAMHEHDVCVAIKGLRAPFVLRQTDAEKKQYELIGDAYIEGVMQGEAVQEPPLSDTAEVIVLV